MKRACSVLTRRSITNVTPLLPDLAPQKGETPTLFQSAGRPATYARYQLGYAEKLERAEILRRLQSSGEGTPGKRRLHLRRRLFPTPAVLGGEGQETVMVKRSGKGGSVAQYGPIGASQSHKIRTHMDLQIRFSKERGGHLVTRGHSFLNALGGRPVFTTIGLLPKSPASTTPSPPHPKSAPNSPPPERATKVGQSYKGKTPKGKEWIAVGIHQPHNEGTPASHTPVGIKHSHSHGEHTLEGLNAPDPRRDAVLSPEQHGVSTLSFEDRAPGRKMTVVKPEPKPKPEPQHEPQPEPKLEPKPKSKPKPVLAYVPARPKRMVEVLFKEGYRFMRSRPRAWQSL